VIDFAPQDARRALALQGFRTRRLGRPGDFDAPDLVLWLRNPDAMASVGLYRDPLRAAEMAPTVRRNTARFGGVFERRRAVAIAWYAKPEPELRGRAQHCVYGALGRPRT
jgi:hypothetical protein